MNYLNQELKKLSKNNMGKSFNTLKNTVKVGTGLLNNAFTAYFLVLPPAIRSQRPAGTYTHSSGWLFTLAWPAHE